MKNSQQTSGSNTEVLRALSRRDLLVNAGLAMATLAVGVSCASANAPERNVLVASEGPGANVLGVAR